MIKIACADFPVGRKTYESALKTVELNVLFDRFPKMETIEKWRAAAPPHFDFIVCASKTITHARKQGAHQSAAMKKSSQSFDDTATSRHALATTMKIAETLRSRIVYFQLPAALAPS